MEPKSKILRLTTTSVTYGPEAIAHWVMLVTPYCEYNIRKKYEARYYRTAKDTEVIALSFLYFGMIVEPVPSMADVFSCVAVSGVYDLDELIYLTVHRA